ncbi:MAG: hypothetical protein WKF58_17720 [Ilumatobacteraceae bacterium]
MEREFVEVRSVLARQYGVDNKLNHITVRGPQDWIGIMASGHTYHELREALELLGLHSDDDLRAAGIRLYQLLMPVPLDDGQIREFAHGLAEVLVIEEKNPTLEWLVKNALYDGAERPKVVGKHDERGDWLIPATGLLDADRLLAPIHARLSQRLGDERLRPLPRKTERSLIPLTVNRTPFYCSGCPHNLSTRVAEGTLVGGGIGCHAMVALMEPERIGDIAGLDGDGQRGRAVDRDVAVRRAQAPRAEPRRRHVLPLRTPRRARRDRRRHRHHVQAALQRHRGDDGWPGRHRCDDRPRRRHVAAARGCRPHHHHVRRARRVRPRRLRGAPPVEDRHLGPHPPPGGAGGARRHARAPPC